MDITSDTIANEVLLARDNYSGVVILVEGDSDEKLYRKFVADSDTLIIPSWGKENALEAIKLLEEDRSSNGVLVVVDADFAHIDGNKASSKDVVITDFHDAEMMIVSSSAFFQLFREMGSKEKINRFLKSVGATDLRDYLLEKTKVIGHLRRISQRDQLNLCFKGLRFNQIIDKNTLCVEVSDLVRNVLALTCKPSLKTSDIQTRLEHEIKSASFDLYQICRGHDFVEIIGIGLRKALGSKSKELANPEIIESNLRLSYDSKDFKSTDLYKKSKKWEKKNKPFIVFA